MEKRVGMAERVYGVMLIVMSLTVAIFVSGLIGTDEWSTMPWFVWPFALGGSTCGVVAGIWIGIWSFRGGLSR